MIMKLRSCIFANLLFLVLINGALSFDGISIPPFGYNLFYDNHSKILFTTEHFRGVYSLNLKDKGVKNLLGGNIWVDSIYSFDNDILLIYTDYELRVVKLSIIHDGDREEMIHSLPFRKGHLFYPVVDPSNRKIAFIERLFSFDRAKKIVKNIRSHVITMNIADHRKNSISQLDMPWPIFSWNSAGDRLYYFKTANGKSGFCVWDMKTADNRIIKKVKGMSIFYLYPRLINERYILFVGKDDSETQILGKLDIGLLKIDSIKVENKDYSIMMSISFTPDNRFLYQTGYYQPFEKKYHNKLYISDINLNNTLVLDASERLIPIGYNKFLDRFIFFRNQKEIISINLDDPNDHEVLYAIPHKK